MRSDGLNVSSGPSGAWTKYAAMGAYLLALLLLIAGTIGRRVRFLGFAGGFFWAAGTVLALLGGGTMTQILIVTLGLLLLAAYAGKRGAA